MAALTMFKRCNASLSVLDDDESLVTRNGAEKEEEEQTANDKERACLQYCMRRGVAWKHIECMLAMDNEMRSELSMKDKETGLYPYMEIAFSGTAYDLEALYRFLRSHRYLFVIWELEYH